MRPTLKSVTSKVMEQESLTWKMEQWSEEFEESARYYFERTDGEEFQIRVEEQEEGIDWSLEERRGEDWYCIACDFEYYPE